MAAADIRKWAGARVAFTLKADSEREAFDVKAFAREHPALYGKYLARKAVRGGTTLKISQA